MLSRFWPLRNKRAGLVDALSFFNDFFYFIKKASVHNFADDDTLSRKLFKILLHF